MYEIRVFLPINTDRNFTENHIYLYFPCGEYMLNNDKMGWINKFIDNWHDNSDSNEFEITKMGRLITNYTKLYKTQKTVQMFRQINSKQKCIKS